MSTLLTLALPLACNEYDLKRDEDVQGGDTGRPEVTATEGAPDIEVSPTSIDFEYVPTDCLEQELVTITNVGDEDLTVTAIDLTLGQTDAFPFEVLDESLVLAAGESYSFMLGFQPPDVTDYTGEITVSSDDPDESQVAVNAVGEGASGGIYEESFQQLAEGSLDMLWIVDNSGSMSDALDHVADNFEDFIDPWLSLGSMDWQMGVVTTDMDNPAQSGRLLGSEKIITPSTPDAREAFLDAVNQGSSGSGSERGFDATVAALSEPLISTDNAGFLREDASLFVLIVTDEDDDSDMEPDEFVDFLHGLKASDDMASFSAFCGDSGWFGCTKWLSWSSGMITAEAGNEYIEAVDETDGYWASICTDDFSDALTMMSMAAAGLTDTFYLSAVPLTLNTMQVWDDGVEVDYDNENGWWYDSGTNSITFNGDTVPDDGSVIDVEYEVDGGC